MVRAATELDVFQGGPLEPFPQPDSNTLTAGELWALREAMEAAAASLLGHMLFEFSRIDVNLSLCLVWVDRHPAMRHPDRSAAVWRAFRGFPRRERHHASGRLSSDDVDGGPVVAGSTISLMLQKAVAG